MWYDAGRIVLDMDNNAILKYKGIPATLSSELSGRDMEAMERLDLRISQKDFRARMPSIVLTKDKNKPQKIKPVYTVSALGMRTARFRQENGMILWTRREDGDNIRKSLLGRMPQANIAANSTQEMPLPTLFEQGDARKANKGQSPNRAGRFALSENDRMKRAKKEQQMLEKLHTADIESENKDAIRSGGKRKQEVDITTTEEELPRIKRVRQDQTSESISDSTLLPEFAPFPDSILKHGMHPVSEPPKRGYKRSREEFSTNDDEDIELPSKRPKAQPVDAHLTQIDTRPMPANDEPTANLINRAEALMPRFTHRRCRNKVVKSTSGDRFPCHTHQIRPQPSPNHHFEENEENRLDESVAFNVEKPDLEAAPEQNLQSVETRLEAALASWFTQQHEDVVDSTRGDTADPTSLNTQDYSFSSAAPPLLKDSDQKTKNTDESNSLQAQISNGTAQLEHEGLDPASLDELFGVDTSLNSTLQTLPNLSEEDSEPQENTQQTTTAVPVQGEPEQYLPETEDDLYSLFGSEDAYEP